MNEPGHNNPPDMTATAGETTTDLSGWMAETPVIETEDQAREAKVFLDRGNLCVKDLEDERDGKVRPLNEQVKTINTYYRGPRERLERVIDELTSRMRSFLLGEERKRIAAAQEAARIAEQAEQAARDAENREREVIAEANSGVIGHDIATVTADADQAFAGYKKASHQAALAEREAKVRIGGGFTRSHSLRNKEIIIIDDHVAAITEIGLGNEIVDEAIMRAARAFKKVFGHYPAGIRSGIERG